MKKTIVKPNKKDYYTVLNKSTKFIWVNKVRQKLVPISNGRLIGSTSPLSFSRVKDAKPWLDRILNKPGFPNVQILKFKWGYEVVWGDIGILKELVYRHHIGDHVWLGRVYGYSEYNVLGQILDFEATAKTRLKFLKRIDLASVVKSIENDYGS